MALDKTTADSLWDDLPGPEDEGQITIPRSPLTEARAIPPKNAIKGREVQKLLDVDALIAAENLQEFQQYLDREKWERLRKQSPFTAEYLEMHPINSATFQDDASLLQEIEQKSKLLPQVTRPGVTILDRGFPTGVSDSEFQRAAGALHGLEQQGLIIPPVGPAGGSFEEAARPDVSIASRKFSAKVSDSAKKGLFAAGVRARQIGNLWMDFLSSIAKLPAELNAYLGGAETKAAAQAELDKFELAKKQREEQLAKIAQVYLAQPEDTRMDMAAWIIDEAAARGEYLTGAGQAVKYLYNNPGAVVNYFVEMFIGGLPETIIGGGIGAKLGKKLVWDSLSDGTKKLFIETLAIAGASAGGTFANDLPQEFAARYQQNGGNVDDAMRYALKKTAADTAVNAGLSAVPIPGGKGALGAAARAAGVTIQQGAAGAAGAAAASASVGEPISPGELSMEFLGEFISAGADIPIGAFMAHRDTLARAVQEKKIRALRAAQDAGGLQVLRDIVVTAKKSTVAAEAPDAVAEAVQHVAGVEEVYIDSKDLRDIFSQTGQNPAQAFPSLAKQVNELAMEGGSVSIPFGEFVAYTSTSNVQEALLNAARLSPDGMTITEAQTFLQSPAAEELKAATAKIIKQNEANAAFVEGAKKVLDDLTAKMNLTGRFTRETGAAMVAPLHAAYVALADRLGVTPEVVYARYPLDIRATAVSEAAFDQAFAPATLADFRPEGLQNIIHRSRWAILTAENPMGRALPPEENAIRNARLEEELQRRGYRYVRTEGKYTDLDNPDEAPLEHGFLVFDIPTEAAQELGKQFEQDSVLTPHGLVYHDNTAEAATGVTVHTGEPPNNYFTRIPETGGTFTLDIDFDSGRKPLSQIFKQSVSTRVPSAKAGREDPHLNYNLDVDISVLDKAPAYKARLAETVSGYKNFQVPEGASADEIIEAFVKHLEGNLTWLYNQVPDRIRKRAKLWYDGGRRIIDDLVHRFNGRYTDAQIAAVLAVFSPQTDWDINVSRAERLLDIYTHQQDTIWTAEMDAEADRIISTARVTEDRIKDLKKAIDAVRGKRLVELAPGAQAIWIRVYDQAHNPRHFRLVTPEGGFTDDFARAADGTPRTATWAGFEQIEKAISILTDGSMRNISKQLGEQHKIRNFYNNLFDPSDARSVTIDTHAVAAALLTPLSGTDIEVRHALGIGPKHDPSGSKGTYVLYAEAYRRAAKAKGLLPREFQSITWEAVRGLFTKEYKRSAKRAPESGIRSIWARHADGKLPTKKVRDFILDTADGIAPPRWVGHKPGLSKGDQASTFNGLIRGPGGRMPQEAIKPISGAVFYQGGSPARLNGVVGVHFSHAPRTVLKGSAAVLGADNAESERLKQSTDDRIKKRINFYVDNGHGIHPESKVGPYAHVVSLSNIYDADLDALNLFRGKDANSAESGVLDAGFAGYLKRSAFSNQGAVVLLGDREVDALQVDNANEFAVVPPPPAVNDMAALAKAIMDSRKLPAGNMPVSEWAKTLAKQEPEIWPAIEGSGVLDTLKGQIYRDEIARALVVRGTESLAEAHARADADQLRRIAKDRFPSFKALLQDIEKLGFQVVLPPPGHEIKSSKRVAEKVLRNYNGDASRVTDVLRATIVLRNPGELDAASELMRSIGTVIWKDQIARPTPLGYRAIRAVISLDGFPAEIQLVPANVQREKEIQHEAYERFASLTSEERDAMRDAFQRAFNAWNSSSEISGASNISARAGIGLPSGTSQAMHSHWSLQETGMSLRSAYHILPSFQVSLYQGTGNRGQISFAPDITKEPSVITLLQGADLSTFHHESAHFFFEVYRHVATDIQARQRAGGAISAGEAQILADMNTLLAWVGVKDLDTWNQMTIEQRREGHEKVARGYEAYLFEGKAPSLELRALFQRFKAWLTWVYRSLRNLNVELTDEVRAVYDRILATDAQIKAMEEARKLTPLFSTKPEGMSAEAWEAYQRLGAESTGDAKDRFLARSLRDMRWVSRMRNRTIKELQKEAAEYRKEVHREVEAEINARPVYVAERFLKRGEIYGPDGTKYSAPDHKLSISALEEMYPDDDSWRALGYGKFGMLANEGLHPDTVAEMTGFTSGDEMIRALLARQDRRELIEAETDARMLERYGDLSHPEGIERAADEAIHNETRARFLETELNALREMIGKPRVLGRAARAYAGEVIGNLRIRDLKPGKYRGAAARAAEAALEAVKKNDLENAAARKRDQLINMYAASAAAEAQNEVEAGVRHIKKLLSAKRPGIDPEYLAQIEQILERYDLRTGQSLKAIDRRTSLAEWAARQEEAGFTPVIPEFLLAEANRTHYLNLSVDEFRALFDTIRNIEHLGRLKKKLLTAKDAREFAAVTAAIQGSIESNARREVKARVERNTAFDRLREGLQEFAASHRKLASLVYEMDGAKDGGVLWNYLVRPMNEAGDNEASMRESATMDLMRILAPVLRKGGLKKKIFIPEINASLSYEGRMMVALNWGNEGNRQRLMDGDGWTEEQVNAILRTLTKEDFAVVQAIWDYLDTFRPKIGEQQKRLTGLEPKWVDPTPFSVILPNGEVAHLRGGYLPAKYDTSRSVKSMRQEAATNIMDQWRGARGQPKTRDSFTKERAQQVVDRPLRKDMGVLFQHVTEVIHRLAWQDWLIDANRLLNSKDVQSAVIDHYGMHVFRAMTDTVEDIARGEVPAENAFEVSISHIRRGVTIAGMAWNLFTALLQPLGLTQSMSRIGTKWVAKGLARWIGSPEHMTKTTEWIYDRSTMMRLRAKTFQREISEIRNVVAKSGDIHVFDPVPEAIKESYFWLIAKAQQVADIPTWLGAYEKALAEDPDEARAAAIADQAVLDAQGGGQIKDLAAVQRGGELMKLFTNFYSYANVTYNLAAAKTRTTDFKSMAQVGRIAVDYLLLFILPSVLVTLMREAIKDRCDDYECIAKELAKDEASYLLGTMVGLRDLGSMIQGFDYSGPAGLRFYSELARLYKQTQQGEVDAAFLKSLNNTAGILFHYPAGQVQKTVEGMIYMADEGTPNPLPLMFGKPVGD